MYADQDSNRIESPSTKVNSDLIKETLIEQFGGKKADWKRLPGRHKDDSGSIVRDFENRKTGEKYRVVQDRPDSFYIETEADASLDQLSVPTQSGLSETLLETDPEKIKIAKAFIGSESKDGLLDGILSGSELEAYDNCREIPDRLIEEAGIAIANLHCFAISEMDEELMAWITPIAHFEKYECCSDETGPISDLLPDFAEAMESCWECCDPALKTPEKIAQRLQQLGFCWHKGFQEFCDGISDERLTVDLSKVLKPIDEEV